MLLKVAIWIRIRTFRLLAIIFMNCSKGVGGLSVAVRVSPMSRHFARRVIPGAAQQETEEHSANSEQHGVVP
jgi:hypothetical protein